MKTLSEILETDFLQCLLCNNTYTDPRLLPCLHTFCKKCIEKHIEDEYHFKNNSEKTSDKSNEKEEETTTHVPNGLTENHILVETSFKCTICQSEMMAKNGSDTDFPENTFVKSLCQMHGYKVEKKRQCDYCRFDGHAVLASHLCLECQDNMCQACTGAHHRTKVTRGHKVIPYEQVKKGLYDIDIRRFQKVNCPKHAEEALDMFCERCEVLVCKECKVGHHDNHRWTSVEKATVKYEGLMNNLLKGIQHQIPNVHNYVQFLANYDTSIDHSREKATNEITEHTEQLHKFIEEQKALCLAKLNEESDREKSEIQVRSSNLKTAAASLENNELFLSNLLKHGKPGEILSLHRQINQRLTSLTQMQMDGLKNRLRASFQVGNSTPKNIETIFGRLVISHDSFTHSESGLASQGALQISQMLPSLKNTPDLVTEFEAAGKTTAKDVWPTGIAVTKFGEIAVVDRDNKCVRIFNQSGEMKLEIIGKAENKFKTPFAVAALKSGDIAITDYEAEDVKVFSTQGIHVMTITEGIKYPRGIAANSKEQIIVLDCQLRQLTVHDPKSGKLIRTIPGSDSRNNKVLVDPFYVAVTPNDNIIVTDTASPHLKFFSPTGEYLANYGRYGMGDREILQPYGVCCDDYGHIFVADNKNHRVHVILPDGQFLQFLVTKDDGCWHPMGVAMTEKGEIIFSQALGKIKAYKYL